MIPPPPPVKSHWRSERRRRRQFVIGTAAQSFLESIFTAALSINTNTKVKVIFESQKYAQRNKHCQDNQRVLLRADFSPQINLPLTLMGD